MYMSNRQYVEHIIALLKTGQITGSQAAINFVNLEKDKKIEIEFYYDAFFQHFKTKEFLFFWHEIVYQDASAIQFNVNEPKSVSKKCTCGAHYTSNPNHHYNWCDII